MKYIFLIIIPLFLSCQAPEQGPEKEPKGTDLKDAVLLALNGSFNNFQQCWQENTQEGIHQVQISRKHQHIHTKISQVAAADKDQSFLMLRHTMGKDSTQVLQGMLLHFWLAPNSQKLFSDLYILNQALPDSVQLSALGEAETVLSWEKKRSGFKAESEDNSWSIILKGDSLLIRQTEGLFQHEEEAYRLLRCRYFSGWIEYPLPENPDSTYRMGNLVLHDQGDIIPLVLGDGRQTDYSVELTQLVYGRRISIMKLAIYQEPLAGIHYNSRSISYTWTNPEARRIGINLRKISSGWTLIEPGYINSNNMNRK